MSSEFRVQENERKISFMIKPDEAQAAFTWLKQVNKILQDVGAGKEISKDMLVPVPMIVNELVGGFAAVAEGRGYGGH